MNTMLRRLGLCLLLVLGAGLFGSGCASTETTENYSSRPWTQPAGWSHGLPSTMNEGR